MSQCWILDRKMYVAEGDLSFGDIVEIIPKLLFIAVVQGPNSAFLHVRNPCSGKNHG
jgi:hypothetical protein